MDTLMKANIFFFVTTIAVVVLTIFLIIIFFYLIKFLSTCNRVGEKLEMGADRVGVEVEEFIDDVRESFIFRLMFPRVTKHRKKRK